MGRETALIWFLCLVIIILVAATIIILVDCADAKLLVEDAVSVDTWIDEEEFAERLSERYPGQYYRDLRGDNIGGNFGSLPTEEDVGQRRYRA